MKLKNLAKDLKENTNEFLDDIKENESTILTYGGVVGVFITAGLTIKASFEAKDILDAHKNNVTKEVWWQVGKKFIPPAIGAVGTSACILGAHHADSAKYAALAALYASDSKKIEEITKKIGTTVVAEEKKSADIPEKTSEAKREVSTDHSPGKGNSSYIGETPCVSKVYDNYIEEYIYASLKDLTDAIEEVNQELDNRGVCDAMVFYSALGLKAVDLPAKVRDAQWVINDRVYKHITFEWDATMDENLKPVRMYDFNHDPEADFD